MELSSSTSPAELGPEQLLRAVSHGLANRLLAIRCCAELAASASQRGQSVESVLAALLDETDETTTLARELVAAAHTVFAADATGTGELARVVSLRLPDEVAHLTALARSAG